MEKLVEIEVKYSGYIRRQIDLIEKMKRFENTRIPENFPYERIAGLSREVVSKLREVNPVTIAQASRIPGVTPAAITALMIALKKKKYLEREYTV